MAINRVVEAAKPINMTATGIVSQSSGKLLGIFVSSASATPTIKVWDNTAASGTVVADTFTPVAGTYYPIPGTCAVGCYITIGGTVNCTLFFSHD